MARKKSSPADDLIALVSMLPWWVGVALAGIAYFVLHRLAVPSTTPVQADQMGRLLVRSMVTGLAGAGQYIVPLVCLGGAGASAWKRRHRNQLVVDVAQAKSAEALDGMTWREFEMLVGEAFRLQGYSVEESGGDGADGGVDLVLSKGGEKFLVQCKQWKALKVGVDVVRQLYGVMAARGATGGFVVTSGRFTADATAFTAGRNVTLVDGPRLFGLIRQAQQSAPLKKRAEPSSRPAAAPAAAAVTSCPTCGSHMLKRTARKGPNAGSQFWGCSTYPKCSGTRPVA